MIIFIWIFLMLMHATGQAKMEKIVSHNQIKTEESALENKSLHTKELVAGARSVQKKVLKNGMTLLVHEVHTVPQVSLQIWYNVGSKDEATGERGIAHLLEHMVFKGTQHAGKTILSESDINVITHMLSGSCNAFTSYDYTGYLFKFPTQHYHEAFPIMADCMTNCTFDDQMLNSEMKAVIQELKLYKDQYTSSLLQEMIGTIFSDHPYHNPIIGYKQDLWSVKGKDLHAFYKKHYLPNNATLVVVGDVKADDVFTQAEKFFGAIPADPDYRKQEYFFNQDIAAKSVTLYRDIQQPCLAYAFVIPGARAKKDHVTQITEWILGKGRGSRLYKKLINELKLATSIEVGCWDLFDHGLFFIACEPTDLANTAMIEKVIMQECADIASHGITEQELERAIKKAQSSLYSLLEDIEDQAYDIGKSFLATGDHNYIFTSLEKPFNQIKNEVQDFIRTYFRKCVMHTGSILALPEQEQFHWHELQDLSDKQDEQILSARPRLSAVEPALYAKNVKIQQPAHFNYPKAYEGTLSNGVKIFSYNNAQIPKISVVLSLKMNSYYDPENMQGLCNFVSNMLTEGTTNYTADQLAEFIESKGMSVSAYPGGIMLSVLKDDLENGLSVVQELLQKATFVADQIEKVRAHLLADIKNFWDDPRSFSGQIIRENIYKGHPYSKNALGMAGTIQSITRKDLISYYQKYASPDGAKIAIVGDISHYNVPQLLEKYFGQWKGQPIPDLVYPALQAPTCTAINHTINRDQVALTLAKISVPRTDPDYDALLIFDQIFGSGVLGSMSSRLFELREQSGLFYGIDGSFISGAYEQPGMLQVKTLVSLDRLQEAHKAIEETIMTAADTITAEEFEEAKRAIINASVENFSSNMSIARTFLHMDRFNLPKDFFDTRAQRLAGITIKDTQNAIKKIVSNGPLLVLKVGRV